MEQPFRLFVVTDTHYFENDLGASGEAYEKRSATDQKCIAETGAIIDAGFSQLLEDHDTQTVLIPGDLIFNGEKESHRGFLKKLQRLQANGKKIYLITAKHDFNDAPVGYVGDHEVPVEGTAREELYALYYEFGFSTAISEHRRTLSYVAQLADGVRLLALNCDGDGEGFTGFDAEQMEWILRQIADAKESGNFIFAMTHYPVLPGSPVMELIGDAKIDHWQKTADTLADAGLNLIFTGHMHMQSITKRVSQQGNPLYDICTGSFVGCPCAYRKVTFLPDGNVQIQSETIRDFDWEKGGRTAQEYFKWRFDRMITDILDAMADDFEFFMSRLGGAKPNQKLRLPVKLAGKLLQRLTLGGVGRLFFVHVDPSLRHVLLRDQAVELVRNIFVGNEPYVQGTPLYEAMDRLLCRLSPILHVVERKVGAGNPTLSDLHAFVLSLIGDENQIDDEAVLPIGWIKE